MSYEKCGWCGGVIGPNPANPHGNGVCNRTPKRKGK